MVQHPVGRHADIKLCTLDDFQVSVAAINNSVQLNRGSPLQRPGDSAPADTAYFSRANAARDAFETSKVQALAATGQRFSTVQALAAALATSMTPAEIAALPGLGWPNEDAFVESASERWMSKSSHVLDDGTDASVLWAPDVPTGGFRMEWEF